MIKIYKKMDREEYISTIIIKFIWFIIGGLTYIIAGIQGILYVAILFITLNIYIINKNRLSEK